MEEANKWKSDPEDYLILVLCHETGHHLNKKEDAELSLKINELFKDISKNVDIEIIELVKKREVLAGEQGKKYIPDKLEKEYEILNLINLEYRYNTVKLKLHELKHKNEIIKLIEKLHEQSKEINDLMEENIKLREENYKLEFNIKD